MSFHAGSITGEITLDESGGIRAMKSIAKEAAAMKGTVDRSTADAAAAGTNNFKGMLKNIGGEFGKKSNLGLGLKLLAGGGAIGGASLASNMFAGYAADISKVTDEYRRGDIGAKEMFGNMARGIPILGGMVRGFDELRLAISGERVEMEKQTAAAKIAGDYTDLVMGRFKAARDTTRDLAAEVKGLKQTWAIEGTNEPFRGMIQQGFQARDQLKKLHDEFLAGAGKAGFTFQNPSEFRPAVADTKLKIADLKAQKDGLEKAANKAGLALSQTPRALMAYGNGDFQENPAWTAASDAASKANDAVEKLHNQLAKLETDQVGLKGLTKGFDDMTGAVNRLSNDGLKNFTMGLKGEFTTGIKNMLSLPLNMVKSAELLQRKAMEDGRALTLQVDPIAKFKADEAGFQNLLDHKAIPREVFDLASKQAFSSAREALEEINGRPNNTRLMADENVGHRIVTAQDQGDAAKETATNTKDMIKLLEKIAAKDNSPKFTTISLPG